MEKPLRWTIRHSEGGGVGVAKCPPRERREVGEIEVMPVSEHEAKVERLRVQVLTELADELEGERIPAGTALTTVESIVFRLRELAAKEESDDRA